MVGYWIDVIMLQVWTVDKQSEQKENILVKLKKIKWYFNGLL